VEYGWHGHDNGTLIEHRVLLASADFIAADSAGGNLTGVDFGNIRYLTYCSNAEIGQSDLSKIKIMCSDPTKYVRTYRMHDNFESTETSEGQLNW